MNNVNRLLSLSCYRYQSKDDIYDKCKIDLKILNDYLINKEYLLGSCVCDTDAILFSYLTQFINHDNGPLNEYIESKYAFFSLCGS